MKKNLSNLDKAVRFILAVGIGILYFTNMISGTTALIGLFVAVILIGTSLIGTCPLYLALGISTRPKS
jgi:hypothetical protein